MTDDLITSLRALAAAQHSDLSVAADAADRIELLTRERDEARAALKPFAALSLWPDDVGDEFTAAFIRYDEDWSDEQNDAQLDDKWIRRGDIRAARKALEAKP